MQKIKIFYKSETPLIEALLKDDNIEEFKPHTLFKKITLKAKNYPDIYFHQGKLDKSSIDMLKNSPICIVNSNTIKEKIVQQCSIDPAKIEVFYPCFTPIQINAKKEKKEFLKELKLNKKTKIIFFSSNNLKSAGSKEFIQTVINLNSTNFKVIIASTTQQITNLKFQLSKYDFEDKIFLYENFENIDLLFAISDIFVLPTHIKSFSLDILKAMYYKTAVFTTAYNHSSEIVDVFATMNLPNDPSTAFKIDALLNTNKDLKTIKKQNSKIAKNFTVEKELEKMKSIVKLLNKS